MNACVYETAFLDHVKALGLDPSAPVAEFVASTAERIAPQHRRHTEPSPARHFTLRGISHPLELPVLLAATDDALRLTGQGMLSLDRTAYGSHYGSGKLVRFLGPTSSTTTLHLPESRPRMCIARATPQARLSSKSYLL